MLHDTPASAGKAPKTAVLLCGDLANPPKSLNLERLCSTLEAALPNTVVEVVPGLCENPARLSPAVTGQSAERVVLGLCSGEYPQLELQTCARKTGLDPFALEAVPLGTVCARVHPEPQATQKAEALLAAAVAKVRAFRGSGPEGARARLPTQNQRVSRRFLFTTLPLFHQPVAIIREGRCAAEAGCQLCVTACPRDGLRRTDGHILVEKSRCEGCGVCLAACPVEAIDLPGWSLPQLEVQLAALLDPAMAGSERTSLLLTCQRAVATLDELAHRGVSYSHHWLPMTVPCLGMVTPSWILQALARGAEAVDLLFCGADCPLEQGRVVGGRVSFCRRLLRMVGQGDRVHLLSASHPERLLRSLQKPPSLKKGSSHRGKLRKGFRLGTLEGMTEAIDCLGRGLDPSRVVLEHPYSPFGVVELRPESCTGCLACIEACPTGALAAEQSGNEVTLTFAASSCTGCGMCADICPEAEAQVVQVRRTTDLDALSRGRAVLHRYQLLTCEGCGVTIGSQALLQRIGASLQGDDEALRATLSRYCPSCRLSLALGARPDMGARA